MAYLVGNKVFSNLLDALRYSEENSMFGGGGSISYFDEGLLTGSSILRQPSSVYGPDVITDPEQIQNILEPTQFAIGPGFDDQDIFKDPAEIDASRIRDDEGNIADIFRDIFISCSR